MITRAPICGAVVWLLLGCGSASSTPARGVEPSDPSLQAIDLGFHPVGSEVVFEVPDGVSGITLVAHGSGVGFRSLHRPDGVGVVDEFAMGGVARFAGSPHEELNALALPQSDAALPLAPGSWRLTLDRDGEDRRSEAELSVWLRIGGRAEGGRLDVNLFVAEGVASDVYLRATLELALDGFAGLRLGEVAAYSLGADAGSVDDDDEARALLEATAGATLAPALNLIAVGDLGGLLGAPSGRAGGVPGLGCAHGTTLSGALIEVSGDPELDAARWRHEAGHLAGLFHTSDDHGFDALGDTPECDDPDAEDCPDAGNVMFPRPTAVPRTELTEAQRRVVLGSTLYRMD